MRFRNVLLSKHKKTKVLARRVPFQQIGKQKTVQIDSLCYDCGML